MRSVFSKAKVLSLCFFSFLLAAFLISSPVMAAASNDNRVNVAAEGTGQTKTEALKDAWMNAVRQAVGMFMQGKTVVNDDKITEEIVSLSRGQVNAYSIIKENKAEDGTWTIKIKATIDKDIMQETVAAGAKSKKVAIDPNLVASKATEENKQQSKEQLWETVKPLLDLKDCVDYDCVVQKGDGEEDKNSLYAIHTLKYNLDKYAARVAEISKILDQIAVGKTQSLYQNPAYVKNAILSIQMKKPLSKWLNNWKQAIVHGNEPYKNNYTFDLVQNYNKNNCIAIRNATNAIIYTFGDDIKIDSLRSIFNLYFIVSSGSGFDDVNLQSNAFEIRFAKSMPMIEVDNKFSPILQFKQKLEISADELAKLQESGKSLQGRYELTSRN